ncbi:MAG: hypothetical protein PWR04_1081, partial [Anaerophaga sp.]|nr:hypothetical protein [Anaerophaga sp.]
EVFCNAGIKPFVVVSKLDACQWGNVVFATRFYKFKNAGCVIDIGENEHTNPLLCSPGRQLFGGERPETETVI